MDLDNNIYTGRNAFLDIPEKLHLLLIQHCHNPCYLSTPLFVPFPCTFTLIKQLFFSLKQLLIPHVLQN